MREMRMFDMVRVKQNFIVSYAIFYIFTKILFNLVSFVLGIGDKYGRNFRRPAQQPKFIITRVIQTAFKAVTGPDCETFAQSHNNSSSSNNNKG